MTTAPATSTPQLQMIWPDRRRGSPPAEPTLVSGYTIRTYLEGDVPTYVHLMRRAGFETWGEDKAQGVLATMHPQGLFFVVHNASGILVATAAAQARPRELHPQGGELGWVGADPDHRGKGLGMAVCAAATRRLLEAGHPTMYLTTDDFRLPAIAIYLKLGWVPFMYLPEFTPRWQAVCDSLGIPFTSLITTADPAGGDLAS